MLQQFLVVGAMQLETRYASICPFYGFLYKKFELILFCVDLANQDRITILAKFYIYQFYY